MVGFQRQKRLENKGKSINRITVSPGVPGMGSGRWALFIPRYLSPARVDERSRRTKRVQRQRVSTWDGTGETTTALWGGLRGGRNIKDGLNQKLLQHDLAQNDELVHESELLDSLCLISAQPRLLCMARHLYLSQTMTRACLKRDWTPKNTEEMAKNLGE